MLELQKGVHVNHSRANRVSPVRINLRLRLLVHNAPYCRHQPRSNGKQGVVRPASSK